MIRYFFIYLGIINLIAFGLFAVDKKRAVITARSRKPSADGNRSRSGP